jgi:MerR family copper efflux transcriptional regulator
MGARLESPFTIGEAAARSGVNAKMIRHCESLGLLATVNRTDFGDRQYAERDVHALRFIRRGRSLGFSMAKISELLKLWQDEQRASSDVKRIALEHAEDLERRIEAMTSMKRMLERLADGCQGNERPDCPIIDELAELTGFARCHSTSTAQTPAVASAMETPDERNDLAVVQEFAAGRSFADR